MCRITGIYNTDNQAINKAILIEMRDVQQHGGPDDAGIFIDKNIGLAHRRLSIIDLSDKGKQPMQFGDWVLSFNGEIYNFKEIRADLSHYNFTTNTDTEVLLKAIDKWGLDALKRCNGMFAFALWNKKTKTLYLSRDRLGIKPLFIYQKNEFFLFSSEIKAFFKHPAFDKTLSKKNIAKYLQYGYFPQESSVFKYVKKISPGKCLIIQNGKVKEEQWYNFVASTAEKIIDISEEEALQKTEDKILRAAQKRLIADVPLGIFLSGGVDSSLLTAILAKEVKTQLKTFTIGVENSELDESKQAAAIAKELGTKHETLFCNPDDFREVVEKLPEIYDEPFGDSSAVPMYLVSQKAKEKVTVCLSGDGGDEIMGGYSKYLATYHYYPKIKGLHYFSEILNTGNKSSIIGLIAGLSTSLAGKISKFTRSITAKNNYDFFQKSSQYISKKNLEKLHFFKNRREPFHSIEEKSLLSYLAYTDLKNFTEGDILTKVDRASMQHGLEVRVPFLDHELVEFTMTLPNHLKISGDGTTKYLTKKILEKYLPKNLIYTRKKGFSVPVIKWLKTYYSDDLKEIREDKQFHRVFGFKSEGLEILINRFLKKKYIHDGYVVWFIFCAYRWYIQVFKNI